jgi:hypothetical protein
LECWARLLNGHEMAKQNSPGLQPWVEGPSEIALKGRPMDPGVNRSPTSISRSWV